MPETTRKYPFTLYAAGGRMYVRNIDQKVIDLGPLAQRDGRWCYELEGGGKSRKGCSTAEAALRDAARHLRFLWLDGQFTSQADARDHADFNLDGAVELQIELDELAPGERTQDATV